MTTYIGTSQITQPNYYARKVYETKNFVTLQIVGLDFTPKSSGTGLTHEWEKGRREYLTDLLVGQERVYNKDSGKEINGGDSFILEA